MRVTVAVGTRPEIIKAAPILKALDEIAWTWQIVLTGQHANAEMFSCAADLALSLHRVTPAGGLPSAPGAWKQHVLSGLRSADRADLGVVVGDTDSALLASEAFRLLNVPILHVEAGLRLRDAVEPEEVNRRIITRLADWHMAPFDANRANLIHEGVDRSRIFVTDDFSRLSLDYRLSMWGHEDLLRPPSGPFWVATVHRRSNLARLRSVARFLIEFAEGTRQEVVLCRRADSRFSQFYKEIAKSSLVKLIAPLRPREFLRLLVSCEGVITDSAGVQQEAAVGGLASIVLRSEVELYKNHAAMHLLPDLDSGAAVHLAKVTSAWSYRPNFQEPSFEALTESLRSIR